MKIGTRESRLAMRQTEIFYEKMVNINPNVKCDIIGIRSTGDMDLKSNINQITNIGAFVKELDDSILNGYIDASVNSFKDIPTNHRKDLKIVAVLERGPDEDVILPCPIQHLPNGARVGTASIRRKKMLLEMRPDLKIISIRGNIHTRLQRLDNGEYDAIVLAKAGLERMKIIRSMYTLNKSWFIPAPAQGAIAVECRSEDIKTIDIISKLDHKPTRIVTEIERKIMNLMGAGCSSPVGINAAIDGDNIRIRAASYEYTDEPRRLSIKLPFSRVIDRLPGIADYLTGITDVIL